MPRYIFQSKNRPLSTISITSLSTSPMGRWLTIRPEHQTRYKEFPWSVSHGCLSNKRYKHSPFQPFFLLISSQLILIPLFRACCNAHLIFTAYIAPFSFNGILVLSKQAAVKSLALVTKARSNLHNRIVLRNFSPDSNGLIHIHQIPLKVGVNR